MTASPVSIPSQSPSTPCAPIGANRTAALGLQVKTLEAEQLRVQIARLRHERLGQSSERLAGEVEQLELRLDEVLADIAASCGAGDTEEETASTKTLGGKARRRAGRPLPESLPRRDVEHLPAEGCACSTCGGALRRVGEDVTAVLEYRPGRLEVVRHAWMHADDTPMPMLAPGRGRTQTAKVWAYRVFAQFADGLECRDVRADHVA